MADGYISTQVCACGCDTLLPQHYVDKGKTCLWGHKTKTAAVKRSFSRTAAPPLSGLRAIESSMQFLDERRKGLKSELDRMHREELIALDDLHNNQAQQSALRRQLHDLDIAIGVMQNALEPEARKADA